MASIRVHKSGKLYIDFRYLGERIRETSLLDDTPTNRRRMKSLAQVIDAQITLGKFDYAEHFPNSKNLKNIELLERRHQSGNSSTKMPSFAEVTNIWLKEHEVEWRPNYITTINQLFNRHILPFLGHMPVDAITREVIIHFRNERVHYRSSGGLRLQNDTINRIMTLVKAVIEHACFEFNLKTPFQRVKKLKEEKRSVEPFSIDEMNRMLADVRADFRDYLIVKFFTGLRTAEINGLRWKYVDLDRGEILIRETFCKGRFDYTKNDHSQREIRITSIVREALERQLKVTGHFGKDGVVFCSRNGSPLDDHNFCNRIWKPMLEDLNIPYRRPYNTRHTAATIMLASGESPEWVARQLGHANTQMLFTVYSRFVPNLTRNDGSALDRLLANTIQAA
ncbi:MAG: hypothetical protein C0509_01065 [Acinetobacter sp.]|nr:hypothetical protein [Acinetobacter sp.]MDZ4387301.1 site-specific integrase [Moraxellaceae bacterium]